MNRHIMIGCPVRNRGWILPRYLDCLTKLHYPLSYLHFCFIINDCSDNTIEILSAFADKLKHQVTLIQANLSTLKTSSPLRGCYSFNNLAYLRNVLLDQFLISECDYLFSLDSDIMVTPSGLSQLLANDQDIVSALVCNGHEVGDAQFYNVLKRKPDGTWYHLQHFPRHTVFEVDCTGAAVLVHRRVIEQFGVRYSSVHGPEDLGFSVEAARKGIKICCDGRIEFEHVMLSPPRKKIIININSLTTSSIE